MERKSFKFVWLGCACIFLTACLRVKENSRQLPSSAASAALKPKHIVFIIGDGFALTTASASVIYEVNQSWLEAFRVIGFHKPYASDDLITDSAAGATAFSTGRKTKNSYLGIDSTGKPLQTIIEWAETKGFATGMLVTCSVTHATPAAFAAHVESRAFYEEIGLSMLGAPLDCMIGGGAATYRLQPNGINLRDSLLARGYIVKNDFGNPKRLPSTDQPFYLFTAENEPPTASAGRTYLPKLAPLTAQFLRNRSLKGSFLMIESSQIDWALHANDRTYLRDELHDFEKTIEAVLADAAQDGETLVIMTGDHECGGLSIMPKSKWKQPELGWATRLHTGALVPVYAYGPGAEIFNGTYENTEIYYKLKQLMER